METETEHKMVVSYVTATSTKNRTIALILCIFGGWLGLHEFYVGKTITGIIYLLTVGLFGIGWIISSLAILLGNFKDNNNAVLRQW